MSGYIAGKIYRLSVNGHPEVYVGSTTVSLARRLADHQAGFHRWLNGTGRFVSSFHLFLLGAPSIQLVEDYPTHSSAELKRREGVHIRNTAQCVNARIAGRSEAEYRRDNHESLRAYSRIYLESNREAKRAYDKQRRTEKRDFVNQKQRENYAKRKQKTLSNIDVPGAE
jgi:hypothetical protein